MCLHWSHCSLGLNHPNETGFILFDHYQITVGTPYNTNVGVQKIPDHAIWKPMVAKRNNTNPWSWLRPQILVTQDSGQSYRSKQPASRDWPEQIAPLVLPYQWRVTTTHMMVRPWGVAVERSKLPWILLWGHFSRDNNTHGNRFNIFFTTGIHNLLHEFWEPWPNRAILEPVVYGTVL